MDKPSSSLEAIEFMVDTNVHRYIRKQIASMLRPRMKPESAKAWLTKCLDPDSDVRFTPDDVDQICEITGRADIYVNYLCDKHGFERTSRKVLLDPVNEIKVLRQVVIGLGKDPDRAIKETLKNHKELLALSLKKDGDE